MKYRRISSDAQTNGVGSKVAWGGISISSRSDESKGILPQKLGGDFEIQS